MCDQCHKRDAEVARCLLSAAEEEPGRLPSCHVHKKAAQPQLSISSESESPTAGTSSQSPIAARVEPTLLPEAELERPKRLTSLVRTQATSLRQSLADAIRSATCAGDCGKAEEECARERIQPFAWHHGVLAVVEGEPEQFADAVLAALFGSVPEGFDTAAWTAMRAIQIMNEAGQERDAAQARVRALEGRLLHTPEEKTADALAAEWHRRNQRLEELTRSDGPEAQVAIVEHVRGELVGLRGALGILLGGQVEGGTADLLGWAYYQEWRERQEDHARSVQVAPRVREVRIVVQAPTDENAAHWAETIRDLVVAEYGQEMRLDVTITPGWQA